MENKKEEESAASNGEGSSSSHGGRDTDEERIGTKRKKVQHFQNFFGDGGGAGFGEGAGGNDGGDINKDEDRIGAKRKKVQYFGNFFGDRGGMGFGGGAGVDDEGDISKNEERIGAKRKKVQHVGNFFGDGGGVGFGGGAGVDDEGDISKNEERIGAKRKKNVQHFGNFFGDEGGAGFEGRGKGNFFRQTETEEAGVSSRAELGMQSTHQAVTDHQQADFVNRLRPYSGLPWQTAQDVHLQAIAQRNTLRAVQNKQGDTLEQQWYESQPSVDQYQQDVHHLQAIAQRNIFTAMQDKEGDTLEQQLYESQPSVDQYQQQHHPPAPMGHSPWQTTQDIQYLQAIAQRNTVQNKQGDILKQQWYESQPSVDQYQQQHHPPAYPMGHPNYGNVLQVRGGTGAMETPDATTVRLKMGTECAETHGAGLSSRAELDMQSAQQTVADHQQAWLALRGRTTDTLRAWQMTGYSPYLLTAQRLGLTAVQNEQGDTVLHLAILQHDQDMVLLLLDVLPRLHTEPPWMDCLNNLKQSPLYLATMTQQYQVTKFLLKANANPLVCDRNGNTPLHLACCMGFVWEAVALLNRTNHINAEGCRFPEVNIRNYNGKTPLHLAASNGHTEVLKLLVGARADVDVQDSKSGRTALHHSVEKNDLPMASYLITETNCNLDCCDFSGNTPLHLASGLGRSAIASLLLEGGADVHALNQEREAPLDHAKCRSHDDIIHLLEEATEKGSGTDPEEGDSLSQLDYRARLSLAILLDQSDDWRRLCHLMNLSALEGGFATFTSPTKDLLSMYEACDGTVSQLRQFLVELNRSDAVNIIDRAMESKKEEENSASKGEGSSSSHDSGEMDEVKIMDEAYRHFASTKDSLDLLFLKFLFVGPPRLGKTTIRRRLMGEIIDLKSAGDEENVHPSTAVVETGDSVMVRNVSNTSAVVTEWDWCATKSLEDEACMLFHNFVDFLNGKNTNQDKVEKVVGPLSNPPECSPSFTALKDKPGLATLSNEINAYQIASPEYSSSFTALKDIPDLAALFNEMMSSPYWKDVKHMFKAHLRMEDTGGQPELMDMLPALTIGPGLYLLFVNLQNDLHGNYEVSYCHKSGLCTIPEMSSYTVEEMMLSTLSSISCSSAIPSGMNSQESNIQDLNEILKSSKSVAYIIGTHKDKVTDQDLEEFDSKLQKVIRSTDFFDKGLVKFGCEDRLVIPIDNMNGGLEEIENVKKVLEDGMSRYFKKLKIPAVWLLFSLCLRKRGKRTDSLKFCLLLSGQFNMSEYETKVALWFLHHHAGVIMYFPGLPELEDLVIIDIQVVYDSVTILILRSMRFKNVGQASAEKFRKTGQFSLQDLVRATAKHSGDLIPPLKLVALLEYLHVIAKIYSAESLPSQSSERSLVYIMPCVLEHASKEQLEIIHKDATKPFSASPLMVQFTCGFVPIGLFPAMIACLIANKSFLLIRAGIKKNLVQFRYGSRQSLVTFMSRPKYYEITISVLPNFKISTHIQCTNVRKEIESMLDTASSRMNYGGYRDYQFSFACPIHADGNHLCVIEAGDASPEVMSCLYNQDDPQPVVLESSHQVWFGQEMQLNIDIDYGTSNCADTHIDCYQSYVDKIPVAKRFKLEDDIKSDEHIHRLAEKMTGWEKMSHLFYVCDNPDVSDIKTGHNKDNPAGQRIDVLNTWKKRSVDTSYSSLLRVFVKGNFKDCAIEMLAVLNQD